MKIGNSEIGVNELFFLVEEGNANNGDIEQALKMIQLAKESGANGIEFQLAIANDFYVASDPGHARYQKREFTKEQHLQLINFAHELGLAFIVAPLSHRLIQPLSELGCDGFTINSSDLNNPQILDGVAQSKKAVMLSLPLATSAEIQWAVTRLQNQGVKEFALLHGQHTMAGDGAGVPPEFSSLGFISTLQRQYQVPVGFVDHSNTTWLAAAAVAAGAKIVTKHLTSDRSLQGPDWKICLEPVEMQECIQNARAIYKSINCADKVLAPGEDIDRTIMRRSIVAATNLSKGSLLSIELLAFKRPGNGIEPAKVEQLLGRKLNRNLDVDQLITLDDVE